MLKNLAADSLFLMGCYVTVFKDKFSVSATCDSISLTLSQASPGFYLFAVQAF